MLCLRSGLLRLSVAQHLREHLQSGARIHGGREERKQVGEEVPSNEESSGLESPAFAGSSSVPTAQGSAAITQSPEQWEVWLLVTWAKLGSF